MFYLFLIVFGFLKLEKIKGKYMNLKNKILIYIISIIGIYLIIFGVVFVINNGNLKNEVILKKDIIVNDLNNEEKENSINQNDVLYGADLNKSFSSDFSPKFGNPDALISVIMFIDFDCPYCYDEYMYIRNIMAKYKDSGYFEFRNMPLEMLHPNAAIIANAAMCANVQNKFWDMFDQIFLNYNSRQNIEDENGLLKEIYKYGKTIGLNMNDFSKCYDDKRFVNVVNKDFVDGVSYGVSATPTFFINGNMISGAITDENWEKLFGLSIEKK